MPTASRIRHGLALAAVLTALTPAAGALAQGAGDEQYADPFADDPTPTATPRPTPAPETPAQSTPAPAPVPAAPAPAPAGPAPAAAAQSSGSQGELPLTGIDGWPIAVAGFALLGAGVTLRLRLREPD